MTPEFVDEVWQAQSDSRPVPTVRRWRLIPETGWIVLALVDEHGERVSQGSVLTIKPDGCIDRPPLVTEYYGLQLDKSQRVVVV